MSNKGKIDTFSRKGIIIEFFEVLIFSSRYYLIPFYIGLLLLIMAYSINYSIMIWNFLWQINKLTKDTILLSILELVDVVMIVNLVKMVITGSYHSFVRKDHGYDNENVSSGLLKVKIGTSLVGVASIHLLQTFVNSSKIGWDDIQKQVYLFFAFLIGALILSVIDFLHCKSIGQ